MTDAAREMRRMFGTGMGPDVDSNQRLTKAREIRHDEELHALQDEESAEAKASSPAARQRKLRLLASVMPWVPTKVRKLARPVKRAT